MSELKFEKTITDPVHGTIGLTRLEADIISTPTFQRLHNVRQLGLAHLVFPGANYSRFSHSVGACHNAGRILQSIERNTPDKTFTAKQHQACRLAGLLHDIGHYPFSHATEHIIKSVYSDKNLLAPTSDSSSSPEAVDLSLPPYLDHETVGRQVIDNDPYLLQVFERHQWEPASIKEIFSKESPENSFVQVISSDLDCDRLDYLRRTAHTSGLPYGTVDIDYLIDQACLDPQGYYCFSFKALRAADHLLVSRYYDYLQVPFHKTVVALEWSLVTCIAALIERGMIRCSSADIVEKIKSGDWALFDDNYFFALFRQLRDSLSASNPDDAVLSAHLEALLMRKAAKLVHSNEIVESKGTPDHASRVLEARKAISAISSSLGIPENFFYVWEHRLELTKAGSKFADAEFEGAVNILHQNKATPLMHFPQALMQTLAKYQFSGVRIFMIDHESRYHEAKTMFEVALPPKLADLPTPAAGIEALAPDLPESEQE
ncbi:HD domain-containing protein [Ralstonia wenshanensis]|uniref:HD domain-containing protein n=1 Tax=Ralstonia wenshanensis TaxID=2842456 RepID=UPI0021B36996|nr:HD domain-containing protein [Ralstonia wenshanensis]MCT7306226.1 HD domain-containing protein [Ralstonia wenshanensis]